ncbi:carbon-nitrogen hydrolase family protein [Motilimonas pumila]|uniref:Carbon-nitrogen hydrolase family protein n=1 Tax=Motilimonas pumila TaxID=2303987 RepID=A0A418YID5_9GAMM|nr:carbon-nitrogen hydrolase family protein [Motilimonas pumila]RJG49991.1 carbon-nitrogen hydrolase family protein [Motilimonas pumila]
MKSVSLIQLISCSEPHKNLQQIKQALIAMQPMPEQLVLLPENALVFGERADYLRHQEVLGQGPLQRELAQLAARYGIYLVCGSMPITSDEPERVYTSSLVFDPQGQLCAHYHKMHLFDVDVADGHGAYRESATFKPGEQLSCVDLGEVKLGLSICYDLRFPALFQNLVAQGANVILVPAAFTQVTGQAHWLALLQARAIETQCYIVAANQGGEHENKRQTWGHSCIISPWGEILSQLTQGVGHLAQSLDLAHLASIRQKMPVQQHQRFISKPLDT